LHRLARCPVFTSQYPYLRFMFHREDRKQQIPPKCQYFSMRLHEVNPPSPITVIFTYVQFSIQKLVQRTILLSTRFIATANIYYLVLMLNGIPCCPFSK
jgi:hypothetical protein